MTVNELIDALGRAPAGTDAFVLWPNGPSFEIAEVELVYRDGWVVMLKPNLDTGRPPAQPTTVVPPQ